MASCQAPGNSTNVSHQDKSRSGVGITAHGVASLRSQESAKGPHFALFFDPFAELLGGEIGKSWVKSVGDGLDGGPDRGPDLADWIDGLAVRTRKIDDEVRASIAHGVRQVCVLGAGLDTRPWRLYKNHDGTLPEELSIDDVEWFEVDFPEIFQFKLGKLAEVGAEPLLTKYSAVAADLSVPSLWVARLQAAGFRKQTPTLWLLEGLTGYLTEAELCTLFQTLTSISCPASRILVTFLGTRSDFNIQLHRYKTDEPMKFCEQWGWLGSEACFADIGKHYAKSLSAKLWSSYYFVDAALPLIGKCSVQPVQDC